MTGQDRQFWTKTGYLVRVDIVSLPILAELKERYGVLNPKPFTYTFRVEETGADVEFVYVPPELRTPPEQPPSPGEPGYELYQQYEAHVRAFDTKLENYHLALNKYVIASCVKVLKKKGKAHWKRVMLNGKWRRDLTFAGIEVTKSNQYPLFLKSEVLKFEEDFVRAIDFSVPREVTMGDLHVAWDRFQHILRELSAIIGDQSLAGISDSDLAALLGASDSIELGEVSTGVVEAELDGTNHNGSP